MQVILVTTIKKLGKIGDIIKVNPGYALNCLLPQNKVMEATEENKKNFESMRAEYEARLVSQNADMEIKAKLIEATPISIAVNASDDGHLYGSITAKNIVDFYAGHEIPLLASEIVMPAQKIRQIGEYTIGFSLGIDREVTQRITLTAK